MVVPVMEVVFTHVGDHTIDDESTKDGQEWLEAFKAGAETIPGVRKACWARSYKDPNIAMHFIDYETRQAHDTHKALVGPPFPKAVHHLMDVERTDLYVIRPHTTERNVLYAPQTNVVTFWGIDEDKFAKLAPEFFTAINQSDACLGYIWGGIEEPVLWEKSGHSKLGRGGIMISGWRSREEHDRDVGKKRVLDAYMAVCTAVKKSETWGMQVSIVENNGHFHKWRRLFNKDLSTWVPSPGHHEGK